MEYKGQRQDNKVFAVLSGPGMYHILIITDAAQTNRAV